jgi:hypothetical protein
MVSSEIRTLARFLDKAMLAVCGCLTPGLGPLLRWSVQQSGYLHLRTSGSASFQYLLIFRLKGNSLLSTILGSSLTKTASSMAVELNCKRSSGAVAHVDSLVTCIKLIVGTAKSFHTVLFCWRSQISLLQLEPTPK